MGIRIRRQPIGGIDIGRNTPVFVDGMLNAGAKGHPGEGIHVEFSQQVQVFGVIPEQDALAAVIVAGNVVVKDFCSSAYSKVVVLPNGAAGDFVHPVGPDALLLGLLADDGHSAFVHGRHIRFARPAGNGGIAIEGNTDGAVPVAFFGGDADNAVGAVDTIDGRRVFHHFNLFYISSVQTVEGAVIRHAIYVDARSIDLDFIIGRKEMAPSADGHGVPIISGRIGSGGVAEPRNHGGESGEEGRIRLSFQQFDVHRVALGGGGGKEAEKGACGKDEFFHNHSVLFLLPKEVVEGPAAGVDFGHHFIDVVAEFFDTDFLLGRDEDARGLFPGDPAVLELLQRNVVLRGRFQ